MTEPSCRSTPAATGSCGSCRSAAAPWGWRSSATSSGSASNPAPPPSAPPAQEARAAWHTSTSRISPDSLDPGLAYNSGDSWMILDATCARLYSYPDASGAQGSHLIAEVARGLPAVSADGLRYTFTIRPGFRFSPPSNAPVTAELVPPRPGAQRSAEMGEREAVQRARLLLRRHRRRGGLPSRQSRPHRWDHSIGRQADDPADPPVGGPPAAALDAVLLRGSRRTHRSARTPTFRWPAPTTSSR